MGMQFERMMGEPSVEDFYKTVFDAGQSTCFALHAKGTTVYPVTTHDWPEFFSINALHGTKDLDPTEDYHKPDRPRRADANVICYRSILIEFDKMPLDEQLILVKSIGLPYSTCTFSGSKSYHFLICLEEPLKTREEYDALVKRVYRAFPEDTVDQANKNPSRLSRVPNNFRMEKHAKQRLIEVNGRVSNSDLEAWLIGKGVDVAEPKKIRETPLIGSSSHNTFGLYPETINFINFGAPEGERNQALFKAACNMANAGWSFDDAFDKLQEVSDLPSREFSQTIKSAFKKAAR